MKWNPHQIFKTMIKTTSPHQSECWMHNNVDSQIWQLNSDQQLETHHATWWGLQSVSQSLRKTHSRISIMHRSTQLDWVCGGLEHIWQPFLCAKSHALGRRKWARPHTPLPQFWKSLWLYRLGIPLDGPHEIQLQQLLDQLGHDLFKH